MEILSSPTLFPFDIDIVGGMVRMVRLSEAAYQTESFLDERILNDFSVESSMPIEVIERAQSPQAPRLNYIFHLGHVGSTLLSRVLGCGNSVFSIREPLILRRLAGFEFKSRTSFCPWPPTLFNARLDTVLKLLARGYHPEQTSLVKTTSFVGEMASLMMARAPEARAILLIVHPKIFIGTFLASTITRSDLSRLSSARISRLRHRFPGFDLKVDSSSGGELAALAWVTELTGLAEADRRCPGRALWIDFDEFILRPRLILEAILVHLNGGVDENEIEVMLASPDFGRYAKATERTYDGSVRQRLINDALMAHQGEVERGLAWIDAAANQHREIAIAARAAAIAFRGAIPPP